jgi:protein gp37
MGPMVNADGESLVHPNNSWEEKRHWLSDRDVTQGTPITMDTVRRCLFNLIDRTPNLDWLLLTKRPENILRMWPVEFVDTGDDCGTEEEQVWFAEGRVLKTLPNIWLGTSVENQETATKRIPHLLKAPATLRFLSCEPLLGPVDLRKWLFSNHDLASMDNQYLSPLPGTDAAQTWYSKVNWVIVGGESGHDARPCNVEWIRDIVRQCKDAGVPVFVKTVGSLPINYSSRW